MSDDTPTPETDAFQQAIAAMGSLHGAYEMCLAFARKLERERDEARKYAVCAYCGHKTEKSGAAIAIKALDEEGK
jgi:hypothetical protein